jgi:hypothetical protein
MRGRWYRWDKKRTVDEALGLSTRYLVEGLNRALDRSEAGLVCVGALQWSRQGTGEVTSAIGYTIERKGATCFTRLRYTTTRLSGEKIENDYPVQMSYTRPHYGGRRWWFICPLVKAGQVCGRRVAKLYLPGGALHFGCRYCHDLTYTTSQKGGDLLETIDNRLVRLRRKLKAGSGQVVDAPPEKPRHMHWKTYGRLCREYWNLQAMRRLAWLQGVVQVLGPGAVDGLPTVTELGQEVQLAWKDHKAQPDRWSYRQGLLRKWDAQRPDPGAQRYTLGEVARAAGVLYEFAREAQAHDLIRADGGRGKRRQRYRRRLARWLQKLYILHQAGYTWVEMKAWTRRRFGPGHEHERRWPAGFQPEEPFSG